LEEETMKKLILGMSAAALMASTAFASEEQDTTQLAALDTSPAAFSKLDADKDGRVSAIEAANDSKLAASFTQADTDKDGYLSSSEFQSLGSGSSQSQPNSMPPDDTTTPPSDTTTSPPQQ
jgi:Ca2+-binding EF-hand superfamily protein